MRLEITFQTIPGQLLPANYQYPISSWLYAVLARGNSEYADFLHNEGYALEKRRFKLFTFSSLSLPRYEREGDRFKLLGGNALLRVCLGHEIAAETMSKGFFELPSCRIGDRILGVDLRVINIESLPLNISGNKIALKALSPIVISQEEMGKKYPQYMGPTEIGYGEKLPANLLAKYAAWSGLKHADELHWRTSDIAFKLLCMHKPESRLVTIKAFTKDESKIKGYLFDFEIMAPEELIAFGLEVGFGEDNAMGFGCCWEK